MPDAQLTDVALFGVMERYGDLAIHAVIDLRRTFSRAELRGALAGTVRDFPVVGSRYEKGFARDRWVPVEGPIDDALHVERADDLEASTTRWIRRAIDPTRERQIRVVALDRGDSMRLVLTLLHLAVDGAGIAAVGHVFGSHLYGVAPALPVEPRRDLLRVLEGLRWFHAPVLARSLVREALRPLRLLAAGVRRRDYPRRHGVEEEPHASWRHVVVSRDEVASLRARCGGATVNDVLIGALAIAAARRSPSGPVVVTYTIDLRRYARPGLIAANSSSILAAIVPRDDISDLPRTVRAVAAVTARHRRELSGPAFLLGPYALGVGAPHAVARALTPIMGPVLVDVPLARGPLVTNVGRIDEGLRVFGDDVTGVRIVGPNIRGVPVPAVVALGFRGELHLELFAHAGLGEPALEEMEREIRDALDLPPAPRD